MNGKGMGTNFVSGKVPGERPPRAMFRALAELPAPLPKLSVS